MIKPHISVINWVDNINLVTVLVIIDQKLKVVDLFVCCKNVVFKNNTNEQIQYLWETKQPIIIFISPLHHFTIHHFIIAPIVSLKLNIIKYQNHHISIDNSSNDIHQNLMFCSINIAHSPVTIAITKTQFWPQTKQITIINVLSKT